VLLVSHRVVIKVLVCHLLGLGNSQFWNVRQDVCGVTVFDYTDGRLVLTRHNDTSHLRELQKPILADF
jgi:broad specificity phosphatase PhoE